MIYGRLLLMGDVLSQEGFLVLSRNEVIAKPKQKEVGQKLRAKGHQRSMKSHSTPQEPGLAEIRIHSG